MSASLKNRTAPVMWDYPVNRKKLAEIQSRLGKKVIIPQDDVGYKAKATDITFSLDAQYDGTQAYLGLDVQRWNGQKLGTYVAIGHVTMPYVPHYFCFREGPPLIQFVTVVSKHLSIRPDLIIVDGHGIAHPRRFGLACWVGVQSGTPTIGCAKQALIWCKTDIEKKRGTTYQIEDRGDVLGTALVTQDNTNPVFVSPGHKVSVKTSTEIILHFTKKYRICEPLRRADKSARSFAKGVVPEWVTPLGELTQ